MDGVHLVANFPLLAHVILSALARGTDEGFHEDNHRLVPWPQHLLKQTNKKNMHTDSQSTVY